MNAGDSGVGAIARIDRALIQPGHLIAMHPHRDDEILTYLRGGAMLHRDTLGREEEITPRRLMMNAGRLFQHEEQMIGDRPVEALQIFLRPRTPGLEPRVQLHDFETPHHQGDWRLIAGPDGAPLEVRAQVWVRDARIGAGHALALPPPDAEAQARLIVVFRGSVRVGELTLSDGESALLAPEDGALEAVTDADLVLLSTDTAAPVFRGGMFSGNVMRL